MADIIYVDCYKGFDGLTIRIDTNSRTALAMIQQAFQNLAEGNITEIEFLQLEGVSGENIESPKLQLVAQDPPYRAIQKTSEGPEFCWSRSKEGWKDCAWLINGMLVGDNPGYQYFDQILGHESVVVIARGER